MKALQVPFCFHPDPVGGTEVYVEALARHLEEAGVRTLVAAPGGGDAAYAYEGLQVRRFGLSQVADPRDLYGEGDAQAAGAFGRILDEERPDVVHLHAFTRGVSVRLLREARARRIPVVFTYHTPTVSCQRGTLLRWGSEVCDGTLDLDLCTRCTLHGLGVSRGIAEVVGRVPVSAGRALGSMGCSGGAWTALRMRELVHARHAACRALMAEADHIVAPSRWVQALLRRNGVPADKLTVSRQGLPRLSTDGNGAAALDPTRSPLRIAYLGRFDPTKGPDILLRALRLLAGAPLELHLYGVVQEGAGPAYRWELESLAAGDPRIAFLPTVPTDRVVPLLRGYHLLAAPSRLLETGPLVVLEAFAAGIPVLGSNLGGIAELVEDGVNGLLVKPGSPEAWSRALRRVTDDRALLARLRKGIREPRHMGAVAGEMVALYRAVLGQQRASEEAAGSFVAPA